jgi:hypothetical protein
MRPRPTTSCCPTARACWVGWGMNMCQHVFHASSCGIRCRLPGGCTCLPAPPPAACVCLHFFVCVHVLPSPRHPTPSPPSPPACPPDPPSVPKYFHGGAAPAPPACSATRSARRALRALRTAIWPSTSPRGTTYTGQNLSGSTAPTRRPYRRSEVRGRAHRGRGGVREGAQVPHARRGAREVGGHCREPPATPSSHPRNHHIHATCCRLHACPAPGPHSLPIQLRL